MKANNQIKILTNGGEMSAAPGVRLNPIHVVLVEDEPELRQVICEALLSMGHTVQAFATPIQAITHLRNDFRGCDLLITEVLMLDMSGQELYKAVRELNVVAKCIYSSARLKIDLEEYCLPPEIPFLQKPYGFEILKTTIESQFLAEKAGL